MRLQDLSGMKFAKLRAVEYAGASKWRCVCDCGREVTCFAYSLKSGNTRSCGCIKVEMRRQANITHGKSMTKEYESWASMTQRCTNTKKKQFANYGGRGITVCERWRKFENFLADMGECPPGHSIDRIDNDGHYEPSNCRWATRAEQMRNRTDNVWCEVNGKLMVRKDVCRLLGIRDRAADRYRVASA